MTKEKKCTCTVVQFPHETIVSGTLKCPKHMTKIKEKKESTEFVTNDYGTWKMVTEGNTLTISLTSLWSVKTEGKL